MKKRSKKPSMKANSCPRCGHVLFWNGELMLMHCFSCGGWFVYGRTKYV